jgi:hypothetical protein
MFRSVGSKYLCLAIAIVLASAPVCALQEGGAAASTVSESSSGSLQKVFISNTSDGKGVVFEDLPRLTYNRFYMAMENSGRYELVAFPAAADLIFEINYSEPWEYIVPDALPHNNHVGVPCPTSQGYKQDHAYAPQIRLGVWNARSKTFLGSFVEPFSGAYDAAKAVFGPTDKETWAQIFQVSDSRMNEKVDAAIQVLINRARHLLGQPTTSISISQKIPEAPVTTQIARAARVFISNPGGPNNPAAIAGADQLYDKVLAEIKAWGRFEVVDRPESADLVFDLSLLETPRVVFQLRKKGDFEPDDGAHCDYRVFAITVHDRQIKLSITAPGAPIVLWGFFQPVDAQFRTGNPKSKLDRATKVLLKDLRHVVEKSAAAVSLKASAAGASPAP